MKDFINYNGNLSNLSKDDLKTLFKELEDYHLRYRQSLKIDKKQSFGLEIEFGKIKRFDVEEKLKEFPYQFANWNVHDDISVEELNEKMEIFGGEVSSPILHDTKEDWQKLKDIINILKTLKAKATEKTAFQINVGAHIFQDDLENVKNFIKLWCAFENIIYRFGYGTTSIARPFINDFAKPLRPTYKRLATSYYGFFHTVSTLKMLDFGKRWGVNFKKYRHLGSEEIENNVIEVRCPNGILNNSLAQNMVNFYVKLMLYVTSDRFDVKLVNQLFDNAAIQGLEEYSNLDIKKALFLSDLIFDNSHDKINFLKQYIKKEDYFILQRLK